MRTPAVLAVFVVLLAGPAEALWVELTPEQIQAATAHGKATYERWRAEGRAFDDMDPEYVVDLGRDVGRAIFFTEFSTLALETRRWLGIQQQLKAEDIERILAPIRGRLQVSVVLLGPSRDFLRHYTVRLLQSGRSLEPVNWDVFRGTRHGGAAERWVAPAQYTFSAKDLDLNAPVTLLLRDQGDQEIRFEVDLSRVR